MATIKIDNKNLFYHDIGNGPAILFLHSFLWDSEIWRAQINHFSKNHRCICPDLWGHGFSETPESPLSSIKEISNHIAKFIHYLGLKQVHLVGNSLGGLIALNLCIQSTQFINSLTLINTSVNEEPKDKFKEYSSLITTCRSLGYIPKGIQDELGYLYLAENTIKTNLSLLTNAHHYWSEITGPRLDFILSLGELLLNRKPFWVDISRLDLPTMVLAGEKNIIHPITESIQLSDYIRNSLFISIENAGHLPSLEQPEKLIHYMENFINRKPVDTLSLMNAL